MDTSLVWEKDLRFEGNNTDGSTVLLDASIEHGGNGQGFSPLELILIGLTGCTAMDVKSILEKKRQTITQFIIKAHAERAVDHPKVFTEITLVFELEGPDVDPQAVKRAVELSETKYCSAMAMLRKNSPIRIIIKLNQQILREE